jgi:HNH endonuclease
VSAEASHTARSTATTPRSSARATSSDFELKARNTTAGVDNERGWLDRVDPYEFWGYIDQSDPGPEACWLWVGPGIRWLGEVGYISCAGKRLSGYRVADALAFGDPGPDRIVHHTCRLRGCCRPSHLVAVTEAEHHALHKRGIGSVLNRAFGADLPPWSFFEILDTEVLSRAGYA